MKAFPLLIACLLIGLNALQAQDLSQCKRICKQTRLVQTGPLIGLRTLTLSDSQYVRVVEVVKRGASEKYGILLGDTLTHFNGKVIQNMSYFIAEVAKLQPGDTITVTGRRNGVSILYRFPLGAAQTRRVTEFVCCEDLLPKSEVEGQEELALAPTLDTNPERATTRKATKEQGQAEDTSATTFEKPLEDPMGEPYTSAIEKSEAKRERQAQLEKEREAKRLIKAEADRLRQIEKELKDTEERQAQLEKEEAQLKKAEAELLAQQEKERKAEAEWLAQLKKEQEEDRLRKAEAERLAQLEKEQEKERKAEAERLAQLKKEQEEDRLRKAEAERLAQLEKEQEKERKAEAERLAQLKKEQEEDRLRKAEAERLAQLEKEQKEAQVKKAEAERLAQLEKERAKLSEPDKDLNNIVFDLSPNPAVNFLRVSANEEINYTVKLDIQDAEGNILKSETVKILKGRFDVTISVEDLPNGLYFLKIYVDNTQYVQRFRKEK
jgi:myosin heavy subunit